MKKYIFTMLFLVTGMCSYSQGWITIAKTAPAYSYSLPAMPLIIDSMNVRIASLQTDSLAVFQVLEFKETPLDSSNTAFETALAATSGDTLLALAQSIATGNNATITNSQAITTFSDYKGLEVSMQYNDPIEGETVLTFTRFFFNAHTLIAFTIVGTEANYSTLAEDKDQFFSSINMNTLN